MFESIINFVSSHWLLVAILLYGLGCLFFLAIAGSNTRQEIEMYGARVEDLPPGYVEDLLALRLANTKRIPKDD